MSRLYYIVLGAILGSGIVYMYFHRVDLGLVPTSTTATSSIGTAPTADQTTAVQNQATLNPPNIVWTPVRRTREGFQLELPADAKEIQVPAYDERGGTEQVNMLYSYPGADTSFSVAWADEPPVERVRGNHAEETLDIALNDALARTQTSLISETKVSRLGYPARDFVARNAGGGVFNARLILVGRRLYMLIAAFPSESARRDEDVNHFFDSFQTTAKN